MTNLLAPRTSHRSLTAIGTDVTGTKWNRDASLGMPPPSASNIDLGRIRMCER